MCRGGASTRRGGTTARAGSIEMFRTIGRLKLHSIIPFKSKKQQHRRHEEEKELPEPRAANDMICCRLPFLPSGLD
ncbi:Hypothetical predicted protein [Olea europaea subsp. europaea]|uniref:Uncharacterized protein n=1 Tax=Olea europaea subsp. europaea TaxID=158383 RepID=A0A8S0S9T2_OLEEU|nr:Hypothetical predicted protein [Olea europaea subsp. europaea]